MAEPHDLDVCGWVGSVLVHFELRDGHVRASRQRLCGEAAAKPRVATMRRGWLDFARRNTELAARLAETDSR